MEKTNDTSFLTQFLVGFAVILSAFVYWIFQRQNYFKKHNVPYVKAPPLLGSFIDAIRQKISIYNQVVELSQKPEVKDKPFFGIFQFHKPALMVTDPELIKRITIKDFNSFTDRYSGSDTHDPLGNNNLFAVNNPFWKILRGKLTPFFSSGKLKTMHYLIDRISNNLRQYIEKNLDENGKYEVDMKELSANYTTDVIATCAFGVEANCIENNGGDYRKAGFSMFDSAGKHGVELVTFFMLPQLMKVFNFKLLSTFGNDFIRATVPKVISEREASGNKRNDLIDTLIELKKENSKENMKEFLTEDHLISQASLFFSAGFETSSSTQSFALYEIAKNSEIQEKLRNEIRSLMEKTEGKVTYDNVMNINEMPYLHQVIFETLRLYPILPMLDRVCNNPEGYSLEPFSDFRIPYGMPVYIPSFALQRDARYYPEPLKFDPERFAPENIGNNPPFTNFPFGSGPRNCIGERFALMEMKTGIIKLLKEFRVEFTEKTPKEIVLEKRSFLIQADKKLFLRLVKDPVY